MYDVDPPGSRWTRGADWKLYNIRTRAFWRGRRILGWLVGFCRANWPIAKRLAARKCSRKWKGDYIICKHFFVVVDGFILESVGV